MDSLPIHTIVSLVCWSFCLLPFSASSDSRLLPGKPLSATTTIISDDGTFALGFFSRSNSSSGTKHYYVGIWYNNIPKDNVVWVANRAMPITDPSSATLALTNGSNLALSDTNGYLLWMTNISTKSSSSPEATGGEATLDNSGNFILRSSQGILWQSFDYPTDALLPGMKLRITHKTHVLQRLISWRNPQDPSPGNFWYGADPDEFLQRFIWNGSRPYRRSPVWNNYLVVGQYIESIKSTLYFTLQRIDDEVYIFFGLPVPTVSSVVLVKMDYSGKVRIMIWNINMSKWTDLQSEPNQECNKFGYCGPFGYCDNTQPIVTCKCLDGFEPNNKQDWTANRFSQGCHRMEALRCGQGDGFLNLSTMKVPDKFLYVKNRSFNECIAECTSNCSCTAYAYANMGTKAINGDETRCLLWMGDLIDTEKLIGQGENLYIRVNRLSDKKWSGNVLKIALPVVSSLLIIICVCLVWICKSGGKRRNKEIWKKIMSGTSSTAAELRDGNLKYPFISFREIVLATNNFSNANMIGHGGFGNVYKGILGDEEIAVKRLSKGSGQGALEFRNEVILIAKLQHQNLVRLLGFCIHGDEKLLIYEYLTNKSLDAFLFDATRKSIFGWPIRFEIIKGVARGLLYLHQDSRLKIIHRDLKASNILLDAEMSPKISDFGMARIFGVNQQQGNTNRVVGTYGYMSPEYALEGVFSSKSDVYSFGVLLLEIVSGSKISSMHLKAEFPNIIAYAWSLWKDGTTKDFVDSSIVESYSLNETSRCIHIGLLCVQNSPNARPLMSSIVSFLENGDISLPHPKQPIYFAEENYETDGAAQDTVNSANNMSITVLEGR